VIPLQKWGSTYEAYKWRPPLAADDPAIRTVSELENHFPPFAIDAEGEKLYFISRQKFWRANLDGSQPKLLVEGLKYTLNGLSIDPRRNKMYWVVMRREEDREAGIYQAGFGDKEGRPLIITGDQGDNQPYSTDVDETTGDVYYALRFNVVRLDPETKAETRVVQLPPGPVISTIYVNGERGEIWLLAGKGSGAFSVWHCGLDGSNLQKAFDIEKVESENIAIDWSAKKAYFSSRGRIRRANFDGTQREDLVVREDLGTGGQLLIDRKDGVLYFHDTLDRGKAIRRVAIPPEPEPQPEPAPPLIRSIAPLRLRAGGEIALSGRGFTGTTHVIFIDTSTGKNVEAKFRLETDEQLSVIVPELSAKCRFPSIIVRANGALTVTLPLNLHYVKGGQFDRFENDTSLPYWVDLRYSDVERCVLYLSRHATISPGPRGGNTIFLKNDSSINLFDCPDSVLYHEPFADLRRPYRPYFADRKIPDTTQIVPVSAIRPSFVPKLFEYDPAGR